MAEEEKDRLSWDNMDVGLGEVNNIRLFCGCGDEDFEYKDPIDDDWKQTHAAMDKDALLAAVEIADDEVAQMVGVSKKLYLDYKRVCRIADSREDDLQERKRDMLDMELEKMQGWESSIEKLRGYVGRGGASVEEMRSDLDGLVKIVEDFSRKKEAEKEAQEKVMKEIKEELEMEWGKKK